MTRVAPHASIQRKLAMIFDPPHSPPPGTHWPSQLGHKQFLPAYSLIELDKCPFALFETDMRHGASAVHITLEKVGIKYKPAKVLAVVHRVQQEPIHSQVHWVCVKKTEDDEPNVSA